MRVEQSRLKLIKTEFESKLLFDNPLINDTSIKGLSDEFSNNIKNFYKNLPQEKRFLEDVTYEDALFFWFNNGKLHRSNNIHLKAFAKTKVLLGLAEDINEFDEPQFYSDYNAGGVKVDILILKEDDGFFGLMKESLTHGVLVQLANLISRVQELERKRLSLDLHDSVTQHLSGIKFLLSAMENEEVTRTSIL